MEREELSLGKAATAEATVLYSPEVEVPARTTIEPEGGEVRVAAKTVWQSVSARPVKSKVNLNIVE
jgi:hypothetical protein